MPCSARLPRSSRPLGTSPQFPVTRLMKTRWVFLPARFVWTLALATLADLDARLRRNLARAGTKPARFLRDELRRSAANSALIEKISFFVPISPVVRNPPAHLLSLGGGSMHFGSQPRWTCRSRTPRSHRCRLRRFMLRVYNIWRRGSLLTWHRGLCRGASGFYESIARTPLIWLVILPCAARPRSC